MSNFFQTAGGIPTKQVFCYVRVSTEEQALHGLSIEAQTEALENWAAAHGHKVLGVYTDAGISARKPASKRPELQRLLADVQSGKGDLVIFTKLDRWFRNIAEYYKVQEILERHHVDWKTIQEDYDTSTASGRLKINIMLSVAQDEADRTSERIKAVFEIKRQKREPLTGDCPTGYRMEASPLSSTRTPRRRWSASSGPFCPQAPFPGPWRRRNAAGSESPTIWPTKCWAARRIAASATA